MNVPVSVVLLAAGYGTRLYPLTKDRPKALLPLGGGVVLDWIVDGLAEVPSLSKIVLVTNRLFVQQFEGWSKTQSRRVALVDDGTSTPAERLGAIRDLLLALKHVESHEDVLVLGTDNLFTWSLAPFVAFAQTKRPAATVALQDVGSIEEARRCAVVELDHQARLIRCVEKPNQPSSRTVALCVYYFPPTIRNRMEAFVSTETRTDAPGYFLEWLVRKEPVYGYRASGMWVDIGTPETYQQITQQWTQVR